MRRFRKNVNTSVRFQENFTPTLTKTMTYKVIESKVKNQILEKIISALPLKTALP